MMDPEVLKLSLGITACLNALVAGWDWKAGRDWHFYAYASVFLLLVKMST